MDGNPPDPSHQDYLEWQTKPEYEWGEMNAWQLDLVDCHMEISRKDRHQERDQPPSCRTPSRRYRDPNPPSDFSESNRLSCFAERPTACPMSRPLR